MSIAAAVCGASGARRYIPKQGMTAEDKEIAESRRIRQLEYKSKMSLSDAGQFGMNCSCSNLLFDKEGTVYRAAETVIANYIPTSTPINFPDLTGLKMELEMKIYSKDLASDSSTLILHEKYSLGDGCTRKKEANVSGYEFLFTIPENALPSYDGNLGSICYTLTRAEHQSVEDIHSFHPMDVTIIPKRVNEWENHKNYLQPSFSQKQCYTFLLSGKIQIWLSTNQQCYEPGAHLRFALKIKNGGGKPVRSMLVQLLQTVHFTSGGCVQTDTNLICEAEGPSIAPGSMRSWNGVLDLPMDLNPSHGDKKFNELQQRNKHDPENPSIAFTYCLRVTLETASGLSSNIIEEFPIHIGSPLAPKMTPTKLRANSVGNLSVPLNNRQLSIPSLAPSLPDYNVAVSTSEGEETFRDGSSGVLPPSYSCIELDRAA